MLGLGWMDNRMTRPQIPLVDAAAPIKCTSSLPFLLPVLTVCDAAAEQALSGSSCQWRSGLGGRES